MAFPRARIRATRLEIPSSIEQTADSTAPFFQCSPLCSPSIWPPPHSDMFFCPIGWACMVCFWPRLWSGMVAFPIVLNEKVSFGYVFRFSLHKTFDLSPFLGLFSFCLFLWLRLCLLSEMVDTPFWRFVLLGCSLFFGLDTVTGRWASLLWAFPT